MHIPVLVREVTEYLNVQPGKNFIDGTCGAAGHTLAILARNYPNGRMMCFDWDRESLDRAKEIIAAKGKGLLSRVTFINDSYANIAEAVKKEKIAPVHGILLDLGMSSDQLEASGRGFSFLRDEPLDMRYSENQELTAREILNQWDKLSIQEVLQNYGEEPFARKISEEIIKNRQIQPILNTSELVGVVAKAIPRKFQYGRIHFATRIWQALRIAVNDELGNLERFLLQAVDILESDGRLAIISFHSLEDRIVKNFFRDLAKAGRAKLLTKKPITAGGEELDQNPRSRSAKLRAIKKI